MQLSNDTVENKTELPENVQTKMENSFGQDFSDVNIHKDSPKADSFNAKAYAQGKDIHFAPGEFQPNTKSGQELIGHELTHVVQQKQGKVNGADVNGKDIVNNDPALEKEADDAGKKASEGQSVEVSGDGSGVQLKEDPKLNITFTDGVGIHQEKTKLSMNYLGEYRYTPKNGLFNTEEVQYVVTGTKEQWSEVLKRSDDYDIYMPYLVGFLKAATDPNWISNGDSNSNHLNKKVSVSRAPNNNEIIEFFKALFSDGVDTDLDLPEGDLQKLENYHWAKGLLFPYISKLITMYLPLYLNEKSGRKTKGRSDVAMNSGGITKFADQTITHDDTFGNPRVLKPLIQSAYASAFSAAKLLFRASDDESILKQDLVKANMIILNSAEMIKTSLDVYDQRISNLSEHANSAFESAWALIPSLEGKMIGFALDKLKMVLNEAFLEGLGRRVDVDQMRDNMENSFINELTDLITNSPINNQMIDSYINSIQSFKLK